MKKKLILFLFKIADKADTTITMADKDLYDLMLGKLNPQNVSLDCKTSSVKDTKIVYKVICIYIQSTTDKSMSEGD